MDWAAAREAIAAWVEDCSGLEDVAWEDEPRQFPIGPHALLTFGAITNPGTDYTHLEPKSSGFTTTQTGTRYATLTVRFRSFSQVLGGNAHTYADTFMIGAFAPRYRAGIEAINWAVVRVLGTSAGDFDYQNRRVSQCSVDVMLSYRASLTIPDTDYFETVEVTPTIDGEELPTVTLSTV